jgi:hypothetical protein
LGMCSTAAAMPIEILTGCRDECRLTRERSEPRTHPTPL